MSAFALLCVASGHLPSLNFLSIHVACLKIFFFLLIHRDYIFWILIFIYVYMNIFLCVCVYIYVFLSYHHFVGVSSWKLVHPP